METAYILLSCEIGNETEIARDLSQIPEVKDVTITYGEYDIVVKIESESNSRLDSLITSKIRKMQKIRSTITLRVSN